MKLTNLDFTTFVLICIFVIILIGWVINKVADLKGAKAIFIRRAFFFIAVFFVILANWYRAHNMG